CSDYESNLGINRVGPKTVPEIVEHVARSERANPAPGLALAGVGPSSRPRCNRFGPARRAVRGHAKVGRIGEGTSLPFPQDVGRSDGAVSYGSKDEESLLAGDARRRSSGPPGARRCGPRALQVAGEIRPPRGPDGGGHQLRPDRSGF